MFLYHITNKEYHIGQVVNVRDFDGESIYHQELENNQKIINEFLSANRPEGEPSRQFCFYAFEKPEYCIYFREKEMIAGQTLHLYSCVMNSEQGHPMILVNQFQKVTEDKWTELCKEYWKPSKKWYFLEYLADEMHIIEELTLRDFNNPRAIMRARLDYLDDASKINI